MSAATYSDLRAVAAEDEWTFTTAILCVWADADVAPPALAACAEALNVVMLASKCASTEELNALTTASLCAWPEPDNAFILLLNEAEGVLIKFA